MLLIRGCVTGKRMSGLILQVEGLSTHLGSESEPVQAVDCVSFEVRRGETFALLGESGCGKSMTALTLMRLLPSSGRVVGGAVLFEGQDLLKLSEADMRRVRGGGISMIFQEPMTSLNPVLTVGQQITESLTAHRGLRGGRARSEAMELLQAVGIPDPYQRIYEYPHQLSGGMKQRVMIAIALANEPELLIADEPTTALDVTIQAQVLELMRSLQRDRGMSIMFITHDLGVVAEMADRVAVMYAGQLVEQASRNEFFTEPKHPYSQKLFDSLPDKDKRDRQLYVIEGFVPSLQTEFRGCRFAPRCHRAFDRCRGEEPPRTTVNGRQVFCHLYGGDSLAAEAGPVSTPGRPHGGRIPLASKAALLRIRNMKVHFPIHSGVFRRVAGYVKAVDGINLEIPQGHTLALVGESGCGKTTAGKGILQLIPPTGGSVIFAGQELTTLSHAELRSHRDDMQIIFQDPYSSMNPRMLVGDIISEGLRAQGRAAAPAQLQARIEQLLDQVGLAADSVARYPHEFSGGQRQRISIARALAVDPHLIVCDEPTSALDVSVQAQILNLLKQLQDDLGISFLFITHDISVVAYLAHEVAVMYLGRIVEQGSVEDVLDRPRHPYTQALLSAVPTMDVDSGRDVIRLVGDMPSPSNPPSGCYFHPRCPAAMAICRDRYPALTRLGNGHETRCHLYRADPGA